MAMATTAVTAAAAKAGEDFATFLRRQGYTASSGSSSSSGGGGGGGGGEDGAVRGAVYAPSFTFGSRRGTTTVTSAEEAAAQATQVAAAAAMLKWMLANVTPDTCIVTRLGPAQAERARELLRTKGLQSREVVEARLKNLAAEQAAEATILAAKIAATKGEASVLRTRVHVLKAQLQSLKQQDERVRAAAAASGRPAKASTLPTPDLRRRATHFEQTCQALTDAAQLLNQRVHLERSSVACLRPLEPIKIADSQYLQQMKAYIDRQFHSGLTQVMESLADTANRSDSPTLRSSNPSRSVREEEINRLEKALKLSEMAQINSRIAAARAKARRLASESLESRKSSVLGIPRESLSFRVQQYRTQNDDLNRRLSMSLQDEIPKLLTSICSAAAMRVQVSDKQVHTTRKMYFLNKQNKVIDMLCKRYARHRMLRYIVERDRMYQERNEAALSIATDRLQAFVSAAKDRIDNYSSVRSSLGRNDQGQLAVVGWSNKNSEFLDSRDVLLRDVYRLLGGNPSSAAARWSDLLVKAREHAAVRHRAGQARHLSGQQFIPAMNKLEGRAQELRALLFGTPPTPVPELSIPRLLELHPRADMKRAEILQLAQKICAAAQAERKNNRRSDEEVLFQYFVFEDQHHRLRDELRALKQRAEVHRLGRRL